MEFFSSDSPAIFYDFSNVVLVVFLVFLQCFPSDFTVFPQLCGSDDFDVSAV